MPSFMHASRGRVEGESERKSEWESEGKRECGKSECEILVRMGVWGWGE